MRTPWLSALSPLPGARRERVEAFAIARLRGLGRPGFEIIALQGGGKFRRPTEEAARLSGIATTRHGHGVPTRRIEVIEAGHPMPDEAGLKAAEETLQLAATAGADDLVLVLLSGGGSANWIAPVEGVSFMEKPRTWRIPACSSMYAAWLGDGQ